MASFTADDRPPQPPDRLQSISDPTYPLFTSSEFTGLFVLNGISILSSLFVVSFIHMYRSTISVVAATRHRGRRRTLLRPAGTQAAMYLSLPASLRLLFIASIIDVLYSCFRIYTLTISMPGFTGNHQANCKAAMSAMSFFNLMSVFVRALLSVHLQLVILNNVSRALSYERHFLIVACVVSVVLAIVPVFTDNYVWLKFDPTMSSAHCGYFPLHRTTDETSSTPMDFVWTEAMARKAVQKGLVIMWTTNFAWLTLTVFYGIFVIISVVIRLVQQRNALDSAVRHRGLVVKRHHGRREFWRMAAKVVRRILQFPLMVVVCHILEVIYAMATLSKALNLMHSNKLSSDTTESNYGLTRLYLASQIMLGMEGIITLFFLPLEPPIRLMLRSMYLRRKNEVKRLGTRRSTGRHQTSNSQSRSSAQSDLPLNPLQQQTQQQEHQQQQQPSPYPQYLPPTAARVAGPSYIGSLIPIDHFVATSRHHYAPSQGSQAMPMTPKRPVPVKRSPTIDDFDWDIVFVPSQNQQRSYYNPSPVRPPQLDDVASTVLALRNDGLPVQQWFVPASLSQATTEMDLADTAQTQSSRTLFSCSEDSGEKSRAGTMGSDKNDEAK
ncbi:hypothetical protein GQ54DRAFT_117710 [Martensiomyces pterosporus]|nr:hypothetical protein GQ54DRAFT_117710 [Martensiomyces pterosporus]